MRRKYPYGEPSKGNKKSIGIGQMGSKHCSEMEKTHNGPTRLAVFMWMLYHQAFLQVNTYLCVPSVQHTRHA